MVGIAGTVEGPGVAGDAIAGGGVTPTPPSGGAISLVGDPVTGLRNAPLTPTGYEAPAGASRTLVGLAYVSQTIDPGPNLISEILLGESAFALDSSVCRQVTTTSNSAAIAHMLESVIPSGEQQNLIVCDLIQPQTNLNWDGLSIALLSGVDQSNPVVDADGGDNDDLITVDVVQGGIVLVSCFGNSYPDPRIADPAWQSIFTFEGSRDVFQLYQLISADGTVSLQCSGNMAAAMLSLRPVQG